MSRLKANWLRIAVHVGSLLPLVKLVWDFSQGNLTANPIQEITLRTGIYSLILLVLSLACTPLSILTGLKAPLKLRRPLGLYGFMYGALHTLNYIGVDYRFDGGLLWQDLSSKAHIWVGLAALLALLPLTVTSTRGWMRRLGKNWERLHWLAYPAALLSAGHFLLLVKADLREPLLYTAGIVLLLLIRLPAIRKSLGNRRHRLRPAPSG